MKIHPVTILFFFVSVPLLAQNTAPVPVRAFQSSKIDASPLQHFVKQLEGKRIVFLGDIIHGEANIDSARGIIADYLIEKQQFNAVAFESGFFDLFCANEEYTTGKDVVEVLNESIYDVWSGSSRQPLDKTLNKNRTRIRLLGFDPKFSSAHVNDIAPLLRHWLRMQHVQFDSVLVEKFGEGCIYLQERDIERLLHNHFEDIYDSISRLLDQVSAQAKKTDDYKIWIQIVQNTAGLYKLIKATHGDLNESTFTASDANIRDSLMAANLHFWLNLYPQMKVICWGASAHFARDFSKFENNEINKFKPMGSWFGTDALIVGAMGFKGKYGHAGNLHTMPVLNENSIENHFNTLTSGDAMFDLSAFTSRMPSYSSVLVEGDPISGDWTKVFDWVLFTKEVTPKIKTYTTITAPMAHRSTPQRTASVLSGHKTVALTKKIIVTGRVVDKNNVPLGYTTILLKNSAIGAVADSKGEFALTIPYEGMDTIMFSNIAFLPLTVSLKALAKTTENIIRLEENKLSLPEVTVSEARLTPRGILNEAIDRISRNYWQGSYSALLLHHSLQPDSANSGYRVIDWTAELYYPDGYTSKTGSAGFHLTKIRQGKSDSSGSVNYSGYQPTNKDFLGVHLLDQVQNRENSILNKRNNNFFNLTLSAIDSSGSTLIYKIDFVCSKISGRTAIYSVNHAKNYKGSLYINAADYAITAIESEIVWDVNEVPEKLRTLHPGLKTLVMRLKTEYEKQDGYYTMTRNTKYENFTNSGEQAYFYSHYSRKAIPVFESRYETGETTYDESYWKKITIPKN